MKRSKAARVLALIAVIGMLVLVVLAVVFAFLDTDWSSSAFRGCLCAAILLPVFAFVFSHFAVILQKYVKNDSVDTPDPAPEERRKDKNK